MPRSPDNHDKDQAKEHNHVPDNPTVIIERVVIRHATLPCYRATRPRNRYILRFTT